MKEVCEKLQASGITPFAATYKDAWTLNHLFIQYIFEHKDSENVPMFCEQLYDLALLSHKPLNPDEMTKFIARSNEILMLLAK